MKMSVYGYCQNMTGGRMIRVNQEVLKKKMIRDTNGIFNRGLDHITGDMVDTVKNFVDKSSSLYKGNKYAIVLCDVFRTDKASPLILIAGYEMNLQDSEKIAHNSNATPSKIFIDLVKDGRKYKVNNRQELYEHIWGNEIYE